MTPTQQSCIYHGNVQVDGCLQRRAESGFTMQLYESSLTKFSACGGTYTQTCKKAWSLVQKYPPCLTNITLLDLHIDAFVFVHMCNQPNKTKKKRKKRKNKQLVRDLDHITEYVIMLFIYLYMQTKGICSMWL